MNAAPSVENTARDGGKGGAADGGELRHRGAHRALPRGQEGLAPAGRRRQDAGQAGGDGARAEGAGRDRRARALPGHEQGRRVRGRRGEDRRTLWK